MDDAKTIDEAARCATARRIEVEINSLFNRASLTNDPHAQYALNACALALRAAVYDGSIWRS